MHKFIILFLTIFLCGLAKSQNIFSALQLNTEQEYKTQKPKKIIETSTSFNSRYKHVNRVIKTFDNAGMLLKEERYDENNILKTRLTFTNDTIHRIKLTRVLENWMSFGYLKETAIYSYDTNFFLIGIADKDANGVIIRKTNFVCNDKGHPTELSLFDGNGNSIGKETAVYFYHKNKVVTSIMSNDRKILSSDTIKISSIEACKFLALDEIYNTNCDITNWKRHNLNGSKTEIEEEYTYDGFGNCIENKSFKVTVENGKRKREKERILKKKYFY
ncbi:hypothetical protein D3C71_207000 [compost metagenome]